MGEREQEENLVMRATEVRQLLKVGRNTLYEWCAQGIIPHKRVGRVILFSRSLGHQSREKMKMGNVRRNNGYLEASVGNHPHISGSFGLPVGVQFATSES